MAAANENRQPVLVGYGEVMSIVQEWEMGLAVIWWRATLDNQSQPAGDFDTPKSQKELRRLEAAFLRTPAQAIRDAVSPHLEAEAAANLKELMAERNRLAHRFLREQAAGDGGFKPGTHAELVRLGNVFVESLDPISRALMSFESYTGPVLEHWPELAQRLADRVFSGQPIPRDPQSQ